MTERRRDLRAALHEASPRPRRAGDWDDVIRRAHRRRLPRWFATRAIPAAALTLASVFLVVLFVRLGGDAQLPAASDPGRVSLLERPQTPAEALTGDDAWVAAARLDPDSLRVAGTLEVSMIFAARNAAGDLCLIPDALKSSAGTTCSPPAQVIARGGLPVSLNQPGGNPPVLLAALVPDSVTAARLDGREVQVTNNVIATRTSRSTMFEVLDSTGWRRIGDVSSPEGGTSAVPTSPAPLARERSEYTVLAVNGSNVERTAGDLIPVLRELGWSTAPPGNTLPTATSIVLFRPGGEIVADNVATDLGIAVKRLLTPADLVTPPEDVVAVVVLGRDWRGARPPGGRP